VHCTNCTFYGTDYSLIHQFMAADSSHIHQVWSRFFSASLILQITHTPQDYSAVMNELGITSLTDIRVWYFYKT
jgi:hypothetical protein